MKKNEPITRIMTREPVTVHPAQRPSEVRALLAQGNFHHVPVVRGPQLIGMISSTDMIRLSFGSFVGDGRAFDAWLDHEYTIEQIMTPTPVTLQASDTVRDAAGVLARNAFHSLPVVEGEALVGIVTSTDIIKYLLEQY